MGGCVKKVKKEMMYSPFLSFALIGLLLYCELGNRALMMHVYDLIFV